MNHPSGGVRTTPRVRTQRLPAVVAGFGIVMVFLNAMAFTATTANPLVSSDAWYFVETFVQKALDGTVSIGDLFAKRDGFDHAQPLNKLFLMFNARYLGLDYTYEALTGVVFGLLGFLLMWRAAVMDWRGIHRNTAYFSLLVALAAVYVSLNSSSVFTWTLVAFGYVTNFFILLTALAAWHAFSSGSVKWFLPASLVCAIVADDSGYLFAIAVSITAFWFGLRTGRTRVAVKLVAVAAVVSTLYFLWYAWLDGTPAERSLGFSQTAHQLIGIVEGPDSWRLLIPFSSSVAYAMPLSHAFPEKWQAVQIALGVIMLGLHLWFWYRASRNQPSAAGFMAVNLMLLFYAYFAGILYGRVASMGTAYFNEPRYVALYQLSVVALLLMAITGAAQRSAQARYFSSWGSVIAAVLLIAVQIPLSRFSWGEAQYNRQYWRDMALQMGELSRNPNLPASSCVANLVVCQWPLERRVHSMELLRSYRLNIFSPDFQQRHGMAPN